MTDAPQGPVGILVVDKPVGPSSMDVCRRVRARLRRGGAPKRVKVGHGGTLDPLASGVLVVLVGRAATRLSDAIMAGVKQYETTVDLSCTSTTDDAEGERSTIEVAEPPSLEQVQQACERWTGTVMQTPPAYSAIKVGGQRAYKLARQDQQVQLEPRPVQIDRIEILAYAWPLLTLDVHCGKGTYIRSLGRDIGSAMGVGGMLTRLRRTRVGDHHIAHATPLNELCDPLSQQDLQAIAAASEPG